MVELQPSKLVVVGSSPIARSKMNNRKTAIVDLASFVRLFA